MGKFLPAVVILVLIAAGVWWMSSNVQTQDDAFRKEENRITVTPGKETPEVPVTPEATETAKITVTAKGPKMYDKAPVMIINSEKSYTAVIRISKGTMKIGLLSGETPVTVNNFVFLAREGYYDNTYFHRIIKGFMIQGGDPTGTGAGSPGYRFDDETITREYTRGTLAMANSGPNTNGSQFFIMHADYRLPKSYVIFGLIDPNDTESLKTLDAIAATPVTDNGRGEISQPTEKVSILSLVIEEK
jgi:cyclophilin family peptidyl-prolyl cis-trans isomerase